jgi:hypothetical protein
LDVASQAKGMNEPDYETRARDAAKRLEPRLSSLTLPVESPATEVLVGLTGAQVKWQF